MIVFVHDLRENKGYVIPKKQAHQILIILVKV